MFMAASVTVACRYHERLRYFCKSHYTCTHGVSRTPCGLTFMCKWGSCRHAAGIAGIMALYAKIVQETHPADAAAAKEFAMQQVTA